jgi:hypothetical protein
MIFRYSLSKRQNDNASIRGLSCDEDGIFIAGDVALVTKVCEAGDRPVYTLRKNAEIALLLLKAYGSGIDLSNHIEGLSRVARHMTEGKWVLAKIAAVQLRLPEVTDVALEKMKTADAGLLSKCCSSCQPKRTPRRSGATHKRDVSDEPRIPAGQSAGGDWTSGPSAAVTSHHPPLVPVQAITVPVPPFELPLPPGVPLVKLLRYPLPFQEPVCGRRLSLIPIPISVSV